MRTADVAQLLTALTVLLTMAHAMGQLFARLRQPQVIGEIVGGLLLGPTVLGIIAPRITESLFASTGTTATVLDAIYQLGLLLLMFFAGFESRAKASEGERRTAVAITAAGLIVPFGVGLLLTLALDLRSLQGPNGTPTSFGLVFAIAIAVTSIPVISRIMLDLGIMHTSFARIVLTAAVLEDVILYVVLAVALALAQAQSDEEYGLWAMLEVDSFLLSAAYFVVVSLCFLTVFLLWGNAFVRWLVAGRYNFLYHRSPVAFYVALLLSLSLLCVILGINPIFGALMAGAAAAGTRSVGQPDGAPARSGWEPSLKSFSLGFFIPLYFAGVGLQLDLVRDFDILFFLWFLLFACLIKSVSVWAGARLAGEPHRSAVNLAVAMNARGGPGIVLATVAFGAGLISESFFTSLVMLSIVTSQLAGVWLGRVVAGPQGIGRHAITVGSREN